MSDTTDDMEAYSGCLGWESWKISEIKKRLKEEKLFLSEMEHRHSAVTYKRAIIEQQKSIIFILEMLKEMAEDT